MDYRVSVALGPSQVRSRYEGGQKKGMRWMGGRTDARGEERCPGTELGLGVRYVDSLAWRSMNRVLKKTDP